MAARLPSPRSLAPVLFLLAVASVLQIPTALAQETTGRLEGRALDAKGQPIADVNVSVTSAALQGGRGCATNAQGRFVLLALPVGEYRVKLDHLAYQGQVFEAVRVRLAQTTTLGDVRLADRVLDQPEIKVSAERPLVDPSSTDMGGVLVTREVAALPVDRDYRSVATLLPEVNPSSLGDPMNFAGSTGYENRYLIDGVDVTEPFRGMSGTSLPYNFVEEVEVRTGGYQAEYRSSLGGTVNAVTHSGGNDVTGECFGFYTRNRPTADPRYAFKPNNGDYALYDVGAGLGGPVLKDRLWYYVAYNPTITREDVEIPGQRFYEDRAVTHCFAAKLTWRANPRNTLVLSAIGDPTVRDGVDGGWPNSYPPAYATNPDPFLRDIRTGGVGFSLDGRHALRDNLLLRTAFSLASHADRNMPATKLGSTGLLFIDNQTGTHSGGAAERADNRALMSIGGLSATWWMGAHELKSGVEYKESRYTFDFRDKYVARNSDTDYLLWDVEAQGRAACRVASAFLQDSWRLTPRLRLNAGVRWDGLYMVASDGKVAQSITDEWQPRAGLTWEPDRTGTQKFSGSLGRFYHDLALWPFFWYYSTASQFNILSFDHDPRLDPTGGSGQSWGGTIQPRVSGLRGQYFDEYTLGYERRVAATGRLGVRGVYRTLGQGLEDGLDPATGTWSFGNPGRGHLSSLPRARRFYRALELTYQQELPDRVWLLASYTLSRNRGNYPGLFNSDFNYPAPNANGSFDNTTDVAYLEGPLPNDRTHVFKLSGSCRAGRGLTLGGVGAWQSGTPLSEYGWPGIFLRPRGTIGRTPSIWDLSLRASYEPPLRAGMRVRPKLTVDWMHVGSPRKPITFDQWHYRTGDSPENQSNPNPFYGQPTQFQPPASVRVGFEAQF